MNTRIDIQVTFIGNSGVGKTTLLRYYVAPDKRNFQLEAHRTTIGVDYATKVLALTLSESHTLDSHIQIWDTAGQERFLAISTAYIRDKDVIFLCFECPRADTDADWASLQALYKWYERVTANTANRARMSIAIVGTKSDLMSDSLALELDARLRQIIADICTEDHDFTEPILLSVKNDIDLVGDSATAPIDVVMTVASKRAYANHVQASSRTVGRRPIMIQISDEATQERQSTCC